MSNLSTRLMSKVGEWDELLAEAASRYPTGSHYIPIKYGGGLDTKNCSKAIYAPRWVSGGIEVGWGYVFYDGEWAEAVVECDGGVWDSAMNELQEQPQISKTKPPDNPYIQQPLIIKNSHKRKTLTII